MNNIKRFFGSAQAAALGVNLISFSAGGAFTWTSPVSPKLNSHDPSINPLPKPITTFEDSLLASIFLVGALAGTLGGGSFSEKIGKKNTLLVFGVLMFLSHLICAFATNIHEFLSARFLIGIGVGAVFSVVPNYVSEIARDDNRGSLGCILGVMCALGQVFIYSLGPFISIRLFSFVNLLPLVVFYAYSIIFLPDSPCDLIKKGKYEVAGRVLLNLRGSESSDIKKELLLITETIRNGEEEKVNFGDLFKNKVLRKSIMITCSLMLFQQFSGICALLAFMQTIFESSGVEIPSAYLAISISIVALISCLICSQILDRLGRKLSVLVSSVMCDICLATLGMYFFLKSKNFAIVTSISWLPVLSLVLFIVFFNLGLALVPWVMIGDLFSTSYKNLASTITAFTSFALGFTVSFCFPFLCSTLGEAGCFWIFSSVLAIGTVFIAVVVPETKGKTHLEIQTVLMGIQKSSASNYCS